jgi:TIR domain
MRARLKAFLEPAAKPPRGVFPGGAKALSGMASAPPSFPSKPQLSMDRKEALAAADNEAWLESKRERGEYDVFMCHNSEDKAAVKEIAELLIQNWLVPWLDEWELRPGLPWQRTLEAQIEQIQSAAVFVGQNGFGPWQDVELDAFLREFVTRRCPVIPVILSPCENVPQLPRFLRGYTWVDFRKATPNPFAQLTWGITGKRPITR